MSSSDSKFANYSTAQAAATSELMQQEDPRWQWIFPVTRRTRDFLTSQLVVLKVCYVLAVAQIFAAAVIEGRAPQALLSLWLLESVANFLIRYLLTDVLARIPPLEIAKRPLLRLLPVFAIILAALHWCWTATLFIDPELDATGLVTLVSFVMLSVAITSIAPASPVICVIYLVPMWFTVAILLHQAQWASLWTFIVLAGALAGVIWSALFIVQSGVRHVLIRGDRIDLLVNDLSERNAEIERLRTLASRQFAVRAEFFSSVSHDFRQRLHAVKLLAQSMLEASVDPGDKRSASQLVSVVDDMDRYVTVVLEFGRLENAELSPKRQKTELQNIFRELDVAFDDLATAGGPVTVVRTTAAVLNTDPAMLMRVIENLMSNAVKFTRGRVLLNARRRGSQLAIEVRDQGPGIPPDRVDAIFDAFYQGESAEQSPRQGIGLGLAIVRRLTESLGYNVEVHTRVGRGTLMRVVIPATDLELGNQRS